MKDWLNSSIEEALKNNRRPVIKLLPSAEIKLPKRPRGRPRLYPEGTPRYYRYAGLHGRSRPRCLAKRCTHLLRRDQKAACSPECADKIFNHALWLLDLLGTTKEEIVNHFDKKSRQV